jgi:hypothetical protein
LEKKCYPEVKGKGIGQCVHNAWYRNPGPVLVMQSKLNTNGWVLQKKRRMYNESELTRIFDLLHQQLLTNADTLVLL